MLTPASARCTRGLRFKSMSSSVVIGRREVVEGMSTTLLIDTQGMKYKREPATEMAGSLESCPIDGCNKKSNGYQKAKEDQLIQLAEPGYLVQEAKGVVVERVAAVRPQPVGLLLGRRSRAVVCGGGTRGSMDDRRTGERFSTSAREAGNKRTVDSSGHDGRSAIRREYARRWSRSRRGPTERASERSLPLPSHPSSLRCFWFWLRVAPTRAACTEDGDRHTGTL